jgi:hypothetical protein
VAKMVFSKMAAMLGKIFNPDSPNEIPFIEFALAIYYVILNPVDQIILKEIHTSGSPFLNLPQ